MHQPQQHVVRRRDTILILGLALLTLSFLVELDDPLLAMRRLLLIALRAESALCVFKWSAPLLTSNVYLRPSAWLLFSWGSGFRDVVNGMLVATCAWAMATFATEHVEDEVHRRAEPEFWRVDAEESAHFHPAQVLRWAQLSATRRAFLALRRVALPREQETLDTALAEFLSSESQSTEVDRLTLAVAGVAAQRFSNGTSSALAQRWFGGAVQAFERVLTESALKRMHELVPWPRSVIREPRSLSSFSALAVAMLAAHALLFRLLEAVLAMSARSAHWFNVLKQAMRLWAMSYLGFRYFLAKVQRSLQRHRVHATHHQHARDLLPAAGLDDE
jgi:hypothetical protein